MSAAARPPRLVITPGDPAGIGPELLHAVAARRTPAQLVVLGSAALIAARLRLTHPETPVSLQAFDPEDRSPASPGTLIVADRPLQVPVTPGRPDPRYARDLLAGLQEAAAGCLDGTYDALVTGPVAKAVICAAGIPFTGHTEYLQQLTDTPRVVMLLGSPRLRVALVTTHLPLAAVPAAVTRARLTETITILDAELRTKFGFHKPQIFVTGLNPHAGEDGTLGREEQDVIVPVLQALRRRGLSLTGPLPADTAFLPENRKVAAAFLCMYHDQGLPVLKYPGLDDGYNTTLGLPFIRTSVDHGTAFALAGSGRASAGSLLSAVDLALAMVNRARDA